MKEIPACPVCGASDALPLETYDDPVGGARYDLFTCASCALVFSRPMEFPGAPWYQRFNYVCGYEDTACAASKTRFPYFLDRLPAPHAGRLLDIGCASGHFLAMAAARGYDVEGLDVDERFVALAQAAGLKGVRQGVLDEGFAREHQGAYVAVAIMEVLEHVADPLSFLGLCREMLKPGGFLLVSVPDNRRPTPFGRDVWDFPPHHLTRWNPGSLKLALERAGFDPGDIGSIPISTSEYSRIWADRSAQWILRFIKRLLYGAGTSQKPMDDLIAQDASRSAVPDKSTRVKMVARYHSVFMALTFPFFYLVLVYYALTQPRAGLSILAVARKNSDV